MRTTRSRRLHAARVATVATVVVMGCYLVAVLSLNLLVARRLTEQADARIAARLSTLGRASPEALKQQPIRAGGDSDLDDAPIFLWSGTGSGTSTAISPGAPPLPRHAWTTAPASVDVQGTTFRIQAVQVRVRMADRRREPRPVGPRAERTPRSRDPVRAGLVAGRLRRLAGGRPPGFGAPGDRPTAPGRVHCGRLTRAAYAAERDRGRGRVVAESATVSRGVPGSPRPDLRRGSPTATHRRRTAAGWPEPTMREPPPTGSSGPTLPPWLSCAASGSSRSPPDERSSCWWMSRDPDPLLDRGQPELDRPIAGRARRQRLQVLRHRGVREGQGAGERQSGLPPGRRHRARDSVRTTIDRVRPLPSGDQRTRGRRPRAGHCRLGGEGIRRYVVGEEILRLVELAWRCRGGGSPGVG